MKKNNFKKSYVVKIIIWNFRLCLGFISAAIFRSIICNCMQHCIIECFFDSLNAVQLQQTKNRNKDNSEKRSAISHSNQSGVL